MKYYFSLTIILFFSFEAIAQPNLSTEVADSLWNTWKDETKEDTIRLKALHKYAWDGYLFNMPDSAYYFAQIEYRYAKEKGLKKRMASALSIQGISFHLRGDFKKALDYYKQNLSISREINNKKGVANSLKNISLIYKRRGEINKALETLLKSKKMSEEIGDKSALASTLTNIGNIYLSQDNYSKAIEYYDRSSKLYELKFSDKRGLANVYNNMGSVYNTQGNYTKAIDYYTKSLKLKEEIQNRRGIAATLGNIGNVLDNKGEYDRAIEYHTKCIEIQKKIGDKQGVATSLNNIGNIYASQEDFNKAINYYSRSIEIKEELGDLYGIALTWNNLGNAYFKLGNYLKAIDYCRKSLKSAVKIGAHQIACSTNRCFFSTMYNLDSLEQSTIHINQLLKLRIKEIEINFPVLSEKQKELYFNKIRGDFELYGDYSLKRGNKENSLLEKTYNNSLMTKGLLLKSTTAMRNSILNSGDSTLIEQYENWIDLKRKIAKAYSKGRDTRALEEEEANELEKKLAKNSQEFHGMKKVQELTWKDVQKNLKPNESAIEFIRFTERVDYRNDIGKEKIYCALIVKPESKYPELIRLFSENDLEKILGSFPGNNLSYIEQVYGNKKNVKTQLYDIIWKPMEESLKGAKKVYVSPVGLLHKISFAALAKKQDVYLCDVYDIETKSSTGKIALPDDVAINEKSSMTIFGGVDYNSDSTATEMWKYLKGSLTEAEKIKKTLKKREVNYFTAKQASEENFKKIAPKSNILHIATHGYFYPDPKEITEELQEETEREEDLTFRGGRTGFGIESFVKNKNPLMRSGLALSGANDVWSRTKSNGEDGVLTAAEVATIDMRNTDLVVLSACETGLGDIKGSEGVYGLQRSFKMAGVKYLIMSLWQVPDKETAEFMTTFYKHLTENNDIKNSFNQTQKEMRKKHDPYYWAAFVLVE